MRYEAFPLRRGVLMGKNEENVSPPVGFLYSFSTLLQLRGPSHSVKSSFLSLKRLQSFCAKMVLIGAAILPHASMILDPTMEASTFFFDIPPHILLFLLYVAEWWLFLLLLLFLMSLQL